MRLYFPVDLTSNLIMIEKLVLGEIWTGDLPIFNPNVLTSAPSWQAEIIETVAAACIQSFNSLSSIFHISIIIWKKGFLCHWILEFTPSWYPKFVFFTNIPFQAQDTPFQNCFSPQGSISSPLTGYREFDPCYFYSLCPIKWHLVLDTGL